MHTQFDNYILKRTEDLSGNKYCGTGDKDWLM